MSRPKWSWTPLNKKRCEIVLDIVTELKDYRPLTLRQIHYRLVEKRPNWCKGSIKNDALYQNTASVYDELSSLVKWMRIHGKAEWEVMTDRTRRISDKRGYEDMEEFIEGHLYWFLKGYDRDLVQNQDVYVELWIEKDALSSILENVAYPFCLQVVTRRGYNSVTSDNKYFQRAMAAIQRGQKPVILYFGDFDPSGRDMFRASLKVLNKMGLNEVETITSAITMNQIKEYGLPSKPGAAKKDDPRYGKYVEKYGTSAWELDALHPRDLEKIARDAIKDILNMEKFETEQMQEELDRDRLTELRDIIVEDIREKIENFYLQKNF